MTDFKNRFLAIESLIFCNVPGNESKGEISLSLTLSTASSDCSNEILDMEW